MPVTATGHGLCRFHVVVPSPRGNLCWTGFPVVQKQHVVSPPLSWAGPTTRRGPDRWCCTCATREWVGVFSLEVCVLGFGLYGIVDVGFTSVWCFKEVRLKQGFKNTGHVAIRCAGLELLRSNDCSVLNTKTQGTERVKYMYTIFIKDLQL